VGCEAKSRGSYRRKAVLMSTRNNDGKRPAWQNAETSCGGSQIGLSDVLDKLTSFVPMCTL